MEFEWIGKRTIGHVARALVFLTGVCAFGQPQLLVFNAASMRAGDVAPGSLAELDLSAQGGPLPSIDFALASAQILPAGSGVPLPLQLQRRASRPGALVLIPSEIPLGQATIALT